MAKGITYFCTDSRGVTSTRYSVNHTEPQFRFARIMYRVGSTSVPPKGYVAYSSTLAGVQSRLKDADSWSAYYEKRGEPGLKGEVVSVRSYPGKHAVEPQA